MAWLAEMARTGQVPLTAVPRPASVAGEAIVQRGDDVDLQVVDYSGAPEVMMATQQPRTAPRSGSDKKGKGKDMASRDASMVDITNGTRPPLRSSMRTHH